MVGGKGRTLERSLKLNDIQTHLDEMERRLREGRLEGAVESLGEILKLGPVMRPIEERLLKAQDELRAADARLKSLEQGSESSALDGGKARGVTIELPSARPQAAFPIRPDPVWVSP